LRGWFETTFVSWTAAKFEGFSPQQQRRLTVRLLTLINVFNKATALLLHVIVRFENSKMSLNLPTSAQAIG